MVNVQKRLKGASVEADFWHGEIIEHVEKKSSIIIYELGSHSLSNRIATSAEAHFVVKLYF